MTDGTSSIDRATFRAVLGRFATGVTIVTMHDADGGDHGMTVSAFSSVSLDPPLVLVCIAKSASMYPQLDRATHVGVNILAEGQEALSRRFSSEVDDRFDGIGYARAPGGSPLLDGTLAALELRIEARVDGGDHMVVIGRVEHTQMAEEQGPLLYYRGGYGRLVR